LVQALTRQQESWGGTPETLANIRALQQPGALVVMAGQQAGLFGGPLSTWWKALTAIQAAKEWSGKLNRPVIPVFWIAADDHDFPEINHVDVVDRDHALRRISYDADPEWAGRPAGRVILAGRFEGMWPALEEALPPSEFHQAMMEEARQCYAPGRTLVDAFAGWISRWLGRSGLVVVNPFDPAIKRLARDLFVREVLEHPDSRRVFDERTQALHQTGMPAQIHLPDDVLNVMWMEDQRLPMRLREGRLEMHHEPAPFDPAGLVSRVRDHPEKVSPNVLLNPLFQDTVFPAFLHVLGPAEISYFAQVRPLYPRFDMTPPVLMPRASLTVMTQRALSALEEWGVAPEALLRDSEGVFRQLKRSAVPPELEAQVNRTREDAKKALEELERSVGQFDAGLTAIVERTRSGFDASLQKLEAKMATSASRRQEAWGRKIVYLRNLVRPYGALQERVLNLMTFLGRQGPAWLEHVAADLPTDVTVHHVMKI
jgi:bacillithiol biosynthesis cysteine-adding enzyme BshC